MKNEINTDIIQTIMVGAIRDVSSKNGTNAPLGWILHDLTDEWSDKLKQIQMMEYHSDEQKIAKNTVPRFYISGAYDFTINDRFPIYGKPLVKSNLMTIDIDEKDNQNVNIWEIREKIYELPYVYSCLKSISGHGFYVIVPIADTDYTKEYYNYIIKLWKRKYDINCDEKANTLVRARIISYDDERDKWIKKDTKIKIWDLRQQSNDTDKLLDHRTNADLFDYTIKTKADIQWLDKMTNKAMELIINDGYYAKNYNAWFHLGSELKNFDNGWELFLRSSQNSQYDDDIKTIERKWKQITASGIDDNLRRKWCGMAKNRFGLEWWKK